jgi:hypothetical protein
MTHMAELQAKGFVALKAHDGHLVAVELVPDDCNSSLLGIAFTELFERTSE